MSDILNTDCKKILHAISLICLDHFNGPFGASHGQRIREIWLREGVNWKKNVFFRALPELPKPPPPWPQFGQLGPLFSEVKIQDLKVSLELRILYILYNILYICNLKNARKKTFFFNWCLPLVLQCKQCIAQCYLHLWRYSSIVEPTHSSKSAKDEHEKVEGQHFQFKNLFTNKLFVSSVKRLPSWILL